ncbi:MAG: 2'-5' RNA ligase family protein, partial [Hylemonella sp.]
MAVATSELPRQSARLFLALSPPAQVRAALAQYVAQWRWGPTARRYAPSDWHLTLHFLGEVAMAKIESIRSSL